MLPVVDRNVVMPHIPVFDVSVGYISVVDIVIVLLYLTLTWEV